MSESLGERMKENYEGPARDKLVRRMPVIVRADGRAFHSKPLSEPFDDTHISAMEEVAVRLVEGIMGAKAAYTQSDEVSVFLTDYDTLRTEPWFGYDQQKLASVTASMVTTIYTKHSDMNLAQFDARAFNIPREEVSNYFLWRMQDWKRNSLSMLARSHFSHSELQGKTQDDQHEMLHEIGVNWASDLHRAQKNGTWAVQDGDRGIWVSSDIHPKYDEIQDMLEPLIECDKQEEAE